MMRDILKSRFKEVTPAVDFCSLRYVREVSENLMVRQNVAEPVQRSTDEGCMITVCHEGGMGYAATPDLSVAGLKEAVVRALDFALACRGKSVIDFSKIEMPSNRGDYAGPEEKPWDDLGLSDKFDFLNSACSRLKVSDSIVDWHARVWNLNMETFYLSSAGARIWQTHKYIAPSLEAVANRGSDTQIRTLGSLLGNSKQGGLEVLDNCGFHTASGRIGNEAVQLLDADNCPSGTMDLLLASDQMMLQIHESIGHPLEIDRILGDERNYAGTSFVKPDMFGNYRYGSDLLNVTFDPTESDEFASYGFDDDGLPAKKEFIIKNGILMRGLGGAVSQARSDLPGVANSRACSWNRPPIDRIANLNVEPGESEFDDLVAQVKHGIYMQTNKSWSIDDSRNKFQFSCEYGQLIEDGKLTKVVKTPGYRAISANFWRNLKAVGNEATFGTFGTPFCGKGEPNQCVRVGHASPACLFADVEVFGGDK